VKLRTFSACLGLLLALTGCAPSAPTAAPKLLGVYASPAADPWLRQAFTCTQGGEVVLRVVNGPQEADLQLRLGEPPGLDAPAFQIDTEEILVAAQRDSPLRELTLEQARELFAGGGDPALQVWAYSSGDELQRAFEALVMQGRVITSLARMAVSPQNMAEALDADPQAVGFLPRHWLTDSARALYSAGTVPVLAITRSEPEGELAALIACLQK